MNLNRQCVQSFMVIWKVSEQGTQRIGQCHHIHFEQGSLLVCLLEWGKNLIIFKFKTRLLFLLSSIWSLLLQSSPLEPVATIGIQDLNGRHLLPRFVLLCRKLLLNIFKLFQVQYNERQEYYLLLNSYRNIIIIIFYSRVTECMSYYMFISVGKEGIIEREREKNLSWKKGVM